MLFAVIGDIHIGPDAPYRGITRKLSGNAEEHLRQALRQIRKQKASLLVQLGDLIEDQDEETDREHIKRGLSILSRPGIPLLNALGNHEQVTLDEQELCALYGLERLYYSRIINGFRFIVLHCYAHKHLDLHFGKEQRNWLSAELSKAAEPCFIISHYSPRRPDISENFWFADIPQYVEVQDGKEVTSLLVQSKKVAAIFSGHIHETQHFRIGDIPCFCIQSLVENLDNDGLCAQAYAMVNFDPDQIQVEMFGVQREYFQYSFQRSFGSRGKRR